MSQSSGKMNWSDLLFFASCAKLEFPSCGSFGSERIKIEDGNNGDESDKRWQKMMMMMTTTMFKRSYSREFVQISQVPLVNLYNMNSNDFILWSRFTHPFIHPSIHHPLTLSLHPPSHPTGWNICGHKYVVNEQLRKAVYLFKHSSLFPAFLYQSILPNEAMPPHLIFSI